MVADVINWAEMTTGERREGNYFAILAFITKLGAAITGFVALQVLEYEGHAPEMPQTETVNVWMLAMYSWFRALFYLLSVMTLMRFQFNQLDLAEVQHHLGRNP
jgi:GPH family glycoside/pentoside/hexuronide:cation symporter